MPFVLLVFALACSNQAEGERCERENGNADCGDGLVCASKGELRLQDDADRCCPRVGDPISDDRCERGLASAAQSTGGSASNAGGNGPSGTTTSSGGSSSAPAASSGGGQGGSGGAKK